MKYLITENQIKRIIEKKFGIDLTDKISMVTNKWELPFEFDNTVPERALNRFLNQYGPMYVITTPKNMYLGQERENGWLFYDVKDLKTPDHKIMRELGIHGLGLSAGDLINAYIEE
jgi:hypothetical protein